MHRQTTAGSSSSDSAEPSSLLEGSIEMPERLRETFENLVVGIQILDKQLRYIYINAKAALHGRRPKEELLGQKLVELYPGIEQTQVFGSIQNCLRTGESERLDNQFHYPDGHVGIFELSLQAVPEGILIASVDVTSERELTGRLLQSQKMEAVGRLAGGVSHDFNNLLTVIKGHCDLLQSSCTPEQQMSITAIRSAGQRAARLTQQLLSLSRHSQLSTESLDLNRRLNKSREFMQSVLGASIQLLLETTNSIPLVKINSAQFEQTLMNLVLNARDAMPSGGSLTIATSHYEFRGVDLGPSQLGSPALDIRIPEMKQGHYLYFRVTDTGIGMSAETQSRIFEPFFTTKEVGRGTGLGLSVVHGAVQRADGYIAVTSELGGGTTFHIFYPATTANHPSSMGGDAAIAQPVAKHILLVEDEDSVRKIVRLSLEKKGYQVIDCNSAESALSLVTHDMSVDLLITDVVMPKMRGPELARALMEKQHNMPVLYMSGYADESMGLKHALRPCDDFLQKPFSPSELLNRVEQLLQS